MCLDSKTCDPGVPSRFCCVNSSPGGITAPKRLTGSPASPKSPFVAAWRVTGPTGVALDLMSSAWHSTGTEPGDLAPRVDPPPLPPLRPGSLTDNVSLVPTSERFLCFRVRGRARPRTWSRGVLVYRRGNPPRVSASGGTMHCGRHTGPFHRCAWKGRQASQWAVLRSGSCGSYSVSQSLRLQWGSLQGHMFNADVLKY